MSDDDTAVIDEPTQEAPEAPASTSTDESDSYKRRYEGATRKVNELNAKAKSLEAEVEALRTFKAQAERASLTEVERLKAELADAQTAAEAARAEAERANLARKYPRAVDFYGDDPLPSEARLEALEKRLNAEADTEDDDEPRVDPNRPRRTPLRTGPRTKEDIIADLRKVAVPGNA